MVRSGFLSDENVLARCPEFQTIPFNKPQLAPRFGKRISYPQRAAIMFENMNQPPSIQRQMIEDFVARSAKTNPIQIKAPVFKDLAVHSVGPLVAQTSTRGETLGERLRVNTYQSLGLQLPQTPTRAEREFFESHSGAGSSTEAAGSSTEVKEEVSAEEEQAALAEALAAQRAAGKQKMTAAERKKPVGQMSQAELLQRAQAGRAKQARTEARKEREAAAAAEKAERKMKEEELEEERKQIRQERELAKLFK